ncbi:alpha/beta hydrolase [Aestuariivirga sp.]|uniref:alpha/beta hydrolase n=1 Tax=Aestuariivirga sp. TaxID=2650926 RepID=UPI00391A63CC
MSYRPPQPGRFEWFGPHAPMGFAPRAVRVYLPPDFRPDVPRPALYVFDGQNAFGDEGTFSGGWHLHTALDRLDPARYVAPIVFAIPHDPARRQEELVPWAMEGRAGEADRFLDWIVHGLIPATRARYPILPGALGAALGGASWGGSLALYGHFRHPHAFGGALCLSPAFWVGNFAVFDWIAAQPTPPISRVYLDCGGREAEGRMLPPAAEMARRLAARGYGRRQLWWRPDPDGEHTEAFWRRRLPRAVRFLYRRG